LNFQNPKNGKKIAKKIISILGSPPPPAAASWY
jgi:hypothetical protein